MTERMPTGMAILISPTFWLGNATSIKPLTVAVQDADGGDGADLLETATAPTGNLIDAALAWEWTDRESGPSASVAVYEEPTSEADYEPPSRPTQPSRCSGG